MSSSGFAARAQSATDRNSNAGFDKSGGSGGGGNSAARVAGSAKGGGGSKEG